MNENTLSRKKPFLVCIDSDGCAIDSMTIKHQVCFGPALLDIWTFNQRAEDILKLWDQINLFSRTRGINRFKGLALCLEQSGLYNGRPEEVRRFKSWTDTAAELSNPALEKMCSKKSGEIFHKALQWSLNVNQRIKCLPEFTSFESVRECLAMLSESAIICIVSSANREAIMNEWQSAGLLDYADEIFSQSEGSKSECIQKMLKRGFNPESALMIGDSWGDYRAAAANKIWFYPIRAGAEGESWHLLHKYYAALFLGSQITEDLQAELVAAM